MIGHAVVRPADEIAARLVEDEAADVVDQAGFFGDGNEQGRRDRTELGRFPARQGLEADDAEIAGAHHGLVEHLEFVAVLDGTAEAGFELLLLQHARFHRRVIGDRLAFGAVLRLVHGKVGAAHQLAGLDGAAGRDGIADGGGDVELEAGDREGLVERMGCRSRGRRGGGADIVVDEGDSELVTADARERRRRRQDAAEAGRQRPHQSVPALMADQIVDRLEAVDVEIDDRQRAAAAGFGVRVRFQDLVEAGAVRQTGHRVGARCDHRLALTVAERNRHPARPERGRHGDHAEQGQRDADRQERAAQQRIAGRRRRPCHRADRLAAEIVDRHLAEAGLVAADELQIVDQERTAEIVQALSAEIHAEDDDRQIGVLHFGRLRDRRQVLDGDHHRHRRRVDVDVADAGKVGDRQLGRDPADRLQHVRSDDLADLVGRAVGDPLMVDRAVRRDDDQQVGDIRVGDAGADIGVDPRLVLAHIGVVGLLPPAVVIGELGEAPAHRLQAAIHHGLGALGGLLVVLGGHPRNGDHDRQNRDDDARHKVERDPTGQCLRHGAASRDARCAMGSDGGKTTLR